LLHYALSRALFRPSLQMIACNKLEYRVALPWGCVQVWRESVGRMDHKSPPIALLRFLGARGRAEQGTSDPLNRLAQVSGEVWIANPPGFGASTGKVSLSRYAQAALTVFDAMAVQWPAARFWVYGQSLGTVAALHVAAQRPVETLVLKNVTPVHELASHHLPNFLQTITQSALRTFPKELNVLDNALKSKARCLFLMSKHDRLSPISLQREVRSAYAGPSVACEIDGPHDSHELDTVSEASYRQSIEMLYNSHGVLA
jgi:hypothetical protein